MAFTYDPTTERGKVRLLIKDFHETGHVFEDADIDAFIELEDSTLTAAAIGLETIAASETLTLKRIKLLDLQTDGPSEAKALLDVAARWRRVEAGGGDFDFADIEDERIA